MCVDGELRKNCRKKLGLVLLNIYKKEKFTKQTQPQNKVNKLNKLCVKLKTLTSETAR